MKKENFVSLILGTVGGILFALGMCMCLLPDWNAFKPGLVTGVIGLAVLLATGLSVFLLISGIASYMIITGSRAISKCKAASSAAKND
ncbi:MAG: hypothetical protein PUC97_03935 [bacterium]|nr:hypothetical protein [bacterium]